MESWIRRATAKICPDDTRAMPKLLSYAACATSAAASQLQLTGAADLRSGRSADAWLSLHSPALGSKPKFRRRRREAREAERDKRQGSSPAHLCSVGAV